MVTKEQYLGVDDSKLANFKDDPRRLQVLLANYGIVEVGDVVYTKSPLKSNPYGIIKTNKGKTGIVSTLYAVYKPKKNVDSEFVQIYFESDFRMNSYMHPLVNKGAKNDMKVSDANALKGPVFFPKIEEQIAIADDFNANSERYLELYRVNLKSRAMYDKEWAEEHGISVSKIQDENGNLIGSMEEAGGKTVGIYLENSEAAEANNIRPTNI